MDYAGSQINIGNISTSEKEIKDIIKAWLAISAAFGIVLSSSLSGFYINVVIAALTVGVGFLLHELGHKFVAQRYGCFAEFRADTMMLIIAIITSFFGFIFAAPGAVMIAGRVSTARNGRISVAGPLVNIVLAIIFLVLGVIIHQGFLGQLFAFGF